MKRFWDKVTKGEPGECWNWQGATGHGYGSFHWRGRTVGAHRVAFELTHGPIPDGQVVRHRCDNRLCVNPEHLELGTQADNMRDMFERGRSTRGRPGWAAKLVDVADDIRECYGRGHLSQRELAVLAGVNQSVISRLLAGEQHYV